MTGFVPDPATAVETPAAFAEIFPARKQACYRLWKALEPPAVVATVPEYIERRVCASIYGADRSSFAIMGVVDAGEQKDAFRFDRGAAAREVYDVVRRRDRMSERHRRALHGELDEDVDELARVVNVLEGRLDTFDGFESGFTRAWVPKKVVRELLARTPSGEADDPSPGQQVELPNGTGAAVGGDHRC